MISPGMQDNFIDQLYQETYLILLKFAQCTVQDSALAEEVVQETFLIACEKASDIRSSPNPKGWLMRTLQNVIRNLQRKRARLNRRIVSSFDVDELCIPAPPDAHNVDIEYADLLSPDVFRLLKLVAIERYSLSEAAQEFGISAEACKKRIQRIRKKMRKKLNEIENDCPQPPAIGQIESEGDPNV